MALLSLTKASLKVPDFLLKTAVIAVVGVGIFVRIKAYLASGSLMLDEANLARNLAELDFAGLWQHLKYEQYAPPIFMTLSKAICLTAGYSELSLRFIPLLSGITFTSSINYPGIT